MHNIHKSDSSDVGRERIVEREEKRDEEKETR